MQVAETCSTGSFKRPKKPIEIYEFEGCPFCRKVGDSPLLSCSHVPDTCCRVCSSAGLCHCSIAQLWQALLPLYGCQQMPEYGPSCAVPTIRSCHNSLCQALCFYKRDSFVVEAACTRRVPSELSASCHTCMDCRWMCCNAIVAESSNSKVFGCICSLHIPRVCAPQPFCPASGLSHTTMHDGRYGKLSPSLT